MQLHAGPIFFSRWKVGSKGNLKDYHREGARAAKKDSGKKHKEYFSLDVPWRPSRLRGSRF
jgi:hypothetical protein